MKIEELGKCPCCSGGKASIKALTVNFYALRQDNGDLDEIYIFGDDDFDVPSSSATVRNVKFSEDNKSVTEVECPRCNENILVDIPIIKQQAEFFRTLASNSLPLTMASSEIPREM